MRGFAFAGAVAVAAAMLAPAAAAAPTTSLVSYQLDGSQRTDESVQPAISANGKVIAYATFAGDPAADDTKQEVYAYDTTTGKTEWISAGPLDTPGNGISYHPAISADGRYVAFESSSSNLVANDTNTTFDVFVRDRRTGKLERIADTRGDGRSPALDPSLSPGGRFVAFDAYGSRGRDVLVHDRATGGNERVGLGTDPSISTGGRYVAFAASGGIAVRDRARDTTEYLSQPHGGACATRPGSGVWGPSSQPALSADGRYVAFTKDTRTASAEEEAQPGDVFVHDRKTGRTKCASVNDRGVRGNGLSGGASISPHGRYVAFASDASNLVGHDTNGVRDVFVRDRRRGTTRRVSVGRSGNQANGPSGAGVYDGAFPFESAISAGGRFVAFSSGADDLVPHDANQHSDVFVRGPRGR